MNEKIKNIINTRYGSRLTPDEYKHLKQVFQGGYTHAKPFSNELDMCESIDKNSIYENVLVTMTYSLKGKG